MGYSYGRNERGHWGLSCDSCSTVGSVRKRTCPYKVLGSSHRASDGQRHALPWCSPPALCSRCFADEGGTKGVHGESCRDGAAHYQAEADAKEAKLDAGDMLVCAAWGDWHEAVPAGWAGVTFSGRNGAGAARLVPADRYHPNAKPALSDYPEAVPWAGPEAKSWAAAS